MASFLEKIRVKTARRPKQKFDLSCSHLTSQNFNNVAPIYYRMMIPDSDIKVDVNSYARFEPMPTPTFMNCNFHTRAFFVPYHTVFRHFDDFLNDSVANLGGINGACTSIESVPYFTPEKIIGYFVNSDFGHILVGNNSADDPFASFSYDDLFSIDRTDKLLIYYNYTPQSGSSASHTQSEKDNAWISTADVIVPNVGQGSELLEPSYYRFTARGRYIMKILESLGYRFDFNSYGWNNSNYKKSHISAMNILAYTRCLFDWYFPGQYAKGVEVYNNIESIFNRDNTYELSVSDLNDIFDFWCTYILPTDYFTAAFDNANVSNVPDGQSINSITFRDQDDHDSFNPATNVNKVTTDGQSTPNLSTIQASGGATVSTTKPTAWGIEMLSRLANFMRRNQMAGAKNLDRYLARYGVTLPDEVCHRSIYLGSDEYKVNFMDVTATNASDGDTLGQFAGKGGASSSKEFTYSTNEFGLFIILNDVTPNISYTQGIDRMNLILKHLDFYHGEFDMVGMESIRREELLMPRSAFDYGIDAGLTDEYTGGDGEAVTMLADYEGYGSTHFGFTPRYSLYKVPRSFVTGNFSNPSVNRGALSWIDSRMFSVISDDRRYKSLSHPELEINHSYSPYAFENLIHSYDFCSDLGDQYLRLFYNTNNMQDNILMQHLFFVDFNAPMAPLYDMFDFKNQDYGDEIKLNVQGTKV